MGYDLPNSIFYVNQGALKIKGIFPNPADHPSSK
jgi:hypothetical protein